MELLNLDHALEMLDGLEVEAIELSSLRVRELPGLLEFSGRADLSRFSHISVHAPTDYTGEEEDAVVEQLASFVERGWPIIAHPDVIRNYEPWRQLGPLLLVENMDKRKPVGRTVEELRRIFDELPDARMCFDIAHARQVDTSMTEAYRIAEALHDIIKQVHVSTVSSNGRHDVITRSAARSFQGLSAHIPGSSPAILETPAGPGRLKEQLDMAIRSLDVPPHLPRRMTDPHNTCAGGHGEGAGLVRISERQRVRTSGGAT